MPVLHFKPMGLSSLYAGYFADEVAIRTLREELGKVTPADSVAMDVVWDNTDLSGAIILHVPEIDTHGESVAAAMEAGEPVPAADLSPLLGTIGAYREYLGGRYDLRILSFELRLSFWDKRTGGACWATGAIGDPAGRELGPCFYCSDFRAEGGRIAACREESDEAWPGKVTGEKRTIRLVSSALRSNPL